MKRWTSLRPTCPRTSQSLRGCAGRAAVLGDLPILLVSGYVGGEVVQRSLELGANEVLKKRLSPRELAMSLARVLHA